MGQDRVSSRAPDSSSPAPEAVAHRIDAPPVIDGRLDESLWHQTDPLSGFVQRTPLDGQPASEPTELRILFDHQALYVGFWLHDSDPGAIVEGESIRDFDLMESDAVLLILDTYHDGKNGFLFGTNPSGIEHDGQVANEGEGSGMSRGARTQQRGAGGGFNLNWDGSWEVATSRDDAGWYAEFRIPFSTLRYASGSDQVWGLNVARRIRRKNEESFWAPVPREFHLYRLRFEGTLSGMELPAQRLVRVTPYVLASGEREYLPSGHTTEYPTELGGDAKFQVTQGLTLDLTYNTDFAQVEVDDAQVNLTRFNLFFPEKRPFFLENAGLFSVGVAESELFFSRRIGIADGQPVPILGGGRLSGRALGLNVGLLHIQTDELEGVQGRNAYSAVRIAKEGPSRSRIGGIFLNRDGRDLSDDHNRTYAVDGQIGVGDAITFTGFLARTETPGWDGRDHAFHFNAAYETRAGRGFVTYREIGKDFNPEMGFIPRLGYRTWDALLLKYYRPESVSWLREIRPHLHYTVYNDIDTGFQESEKIHVDMHFEFEDGALFSPAMNYVTEGLEEPFEIAEGVVLQPGTYSGWEGAWRFNTNLSAPLSVQADLDFGSFLTGTRRGITTTVTARRGSSLSTALRVSYFDVKLPEGEFTRTLLGLRLGYFFTPRIYLRSLVQYSDSEEIWSANVRFGWLNTAGTGLFLVYNDVHNTGSFLETGLPRGPMERSFIVKYTRQFTLFGG